MGNTLGNIFGTSDEPSDEYLQLTDLGGFLSKYIFIMLDKDKKKLVSKQEYLNLVNHFRERKTTEEELEKFLKKHVEEGKSTDFIDEALFRKLIVHLAIDFDRNIVERMRYLMTLFDKDEDGYVNETDLCQVYDTIGINVPMEPIKCLINKYDLDQDGKLSAQEFELLGRSAMNKLFSKKNILPSTEEILVNEAIQRASGVVGASAAATPDATDEASNDPHLVNNNLARDSGYMIVEDVVFGKPVVIKESESCSSSLIVERASNPSVGQSELQEEDGEELLKGSGDFEENQEDSLPSSTTELRVDERARQLPQEELPQEI